MQDGTTGDMLFGVPALVSFISQQITLDPGDLIATGTPAGVGVFREPPVFLEPGDRVRCEIDGIGAVENPIVDWTDDPRRPPERAGAARATPGSRSADARPREDRRRPRPQPRDGARPRRSASTTS